MKAPEIAAAILRGDADDDLKMVEDAMRSRYKTMSNVRALTNQSAFQPATKTTFYWRDLCACCRQLIEFDDEVYIDNLAYHASCAPNEYD